MDARAKYDERPWLSSYPEGVPANIDIPERSLPEVFDEVAERYSDRPAVIFYGNKISYKKLKEDIDRFATALHELGVAKGDKVALYLLNSPQYIIAYFGVLKLGATVTPISPVYTSIEVRHQLEDSGADSIVCQDFLFDNVERSGVELKRVIMTGIAEYLPLARKLAGKSRGNSQARAFSEGTGRWMCQTTARSRPEASTSSRSCSRNTRPIPPGSRSIPERT